MFLKPAHITYRYSVIPYQQVVPIFSRYFYVGIFLNYFQLKIMFLISIVSFYTVIGLVSAVQEWEIPVEYSIGGLFFF
jgi:hypothetical protein